MTKPEDSEKDALEQEAKILWAIRRSQPKVSLEQAQAQAKRILKSMGIWKFLCPKCMTTNMGHTSICRKCGSDFDKD